ncbi:cytochrome c peroxidase [uncultured Paludibaculum sp.]|uniref:cytochrome-c peroxidase n=1 Tax=uncultured Paludibaculum sp. TaxID=1765020 RepID=UPI002AAA7C72|nr:cytochrome c peroxidase [uncultured Paludibaculum sp.]
MKWSCSSIVLVSFLAASCQRIQQPGGERPIGRPIAVKVPLGLPEMVVPAGNPVTAEAVTLGRKLYYDRRVSGDDTIACASCHAPDKGFTDGQRFSTGFLNQQGTRNAPTVMNAAYSPVQFWDGRASSLEDQAGGPIANPVEMNQKYDVLVAKLQADKEYVELFEKAYGPGAITMGQVRNALASFERTVLCGNSAFDRYQYGGDKSALSSAAIRGLAIFRDKAKGNCTTCHPIGEKSALFTDGKFHNIGVGVNEEGVLTDLGRYQHTKVEADKGAVKTPSLRNVALTAPYMHDGSLKTLGAVLNYYAGGGNSNPQLDKELRPLRLNKAERDDLLAFLESLTGEMPADAGPPAN